MSRRQFVGWIWWLVERLKGGWEWWDFSCPDVILRAVTLNCLIFTQVNIKGNNASLVCCWHATRKLLVCSRQASSEQQCWSLLNLNYMKVLLELEGTQTSQINTPTDPLLPNQPRENQEVSECKRVLLKVVKGQVRGGSVVGGVGMLCLPCLFGGWRRRRE